MQKDTLLSFSITEKDGPQMRILGDQKDLVFNWAAITYHVCKELGIPPFLLAASMSNMVRDYEKCIVGMSRIEMAIPEEEGGGGTP